MQYRATAKNIKVSPRKVRLVADEVRKMTIAKATVQLVVSRKRGAVSLKKALDSAIANAVNNGNAKKDDLKIKSINVTEGIRYKRYHFAGRGRTRPYIKRTSHIDVILEDSVVSVPKIAADTKAIEAQVKDMKEKTQTKVKKEKGGAK